MKLPIKRSQCAHLIVFKPQGKWRDPGLLAPPVVRLRGRMGALTLSQDHAKSVQENLCKYVFSLPRGVIAAFTPEGQELGPLERCTAQERGPPVPAGAAQRAPRSPAARARAQAWAARRRSRCCGTCSSPAASCSRARLRTRCSTIPAPADHRGTPVEDPSCS